MQVQFQDMGGHGWRRWRLRRQATTTNAVDEGGAKAATVVDDGGDANGGHFFFCIIFVVFSWLFRCYFEGKVVQFSGAVCWD